MNKLVVSMMVLIAIQISNANQLGNQHTLESHTYNILSNNFITLPLNPAVMPSFTPSIYTTSVAYAERKAEYSNKWYAICFEYNTSIVFVPATYPAGQNHYQASITVWEIGSSNLGETRTKVCEPFAGQYTEKGCFEDDSIYLIKQALHIRDQAFTKKLHPDPTPTPTYYQQWEKDNGKKFPYIKNEPTPLPIFTTDTNGWITAHPTNITTYFRNNIRFIGEIPPLDEILVNWTYNFGNVKSVEYVNGKLIITKTYAAQDGMTYYYNKNNMPENVSWKEVYSVKGTNIVLEYFLKSTYIPPVNKPAEFKFEE